MNDLKVTGKQDFMGKEIPVVLGGFGPDKRCICDKVAAEIHAQPEREIRRRITDNIRRFVENVDYIDLKQRVDESHTLEILESSGYSKQSVTQAQHIYLLSERGYAKLIKIMDSDLAWEIHDKLIDEYFQLREQSTKLSTLSPQLQFMIKVELEQKKMQQDIQKVNQRVDGIRDVVALSRVNWKKETSDMISRIALAWGGYEHIKDVRNKAYAELNERFHVDLEARRRNKRRRMAEENISEAKRNKVSLVDIIAEDPKLIEGFVVIIKEMAIEAGIADMEEECDKDDD